jgi:hypothetical protein
MTWMLLEVTFGFFNQLIGYARAVRPYCYAAAFMTARIGSLTFTLPTALDDQADSE